MIGMITLSLIGFATWFGMQRFYAQSYEDVSSPKTSVRLKKLWDYVDKAVKAKNYSTAERALLTILRLDHKNTAAYNRLGILYAMQQNYEDAIECFDIASSLTPTVQTLYNLGLVNFEYGKYEQAAVALQKVIDLEPSPKRYIAYAKALEKLGNNQQVAETLEMVVREEPTIDHLEMLAQAYEAIKDHTKAEEIRAKMAIKQAKLHKS
jgi:tetratricopeptide (TPR) repeat protein